MFSQADPSFPLKNAIGRWDGAHSLLVVSIRIGLLLLAISLCANILGFFSLSQILGVGTLFSAFIFALLYTMVKVLDLGLAIVLCSKWFQSLPDATQRGSRTVGTANSGQWRLPALAE